MQRFGGEFVVTVTSTRIAARLRRHPEFKHVATVLKVSRKRGCITPDYVVGYDFVYSNPKQVRGLFEVRAMLAPIMKERAHVGRK